MRGVGEGGCSALIEAQVLTQAGREGGGMGSFAVCSVLKQAGQRHTSTVQAGWTSELSGVEKRRDFSPPGPGGWTEELLRFWSICAEARPRAALSPR